ncbi:hypothetical protein [Abyssisolibacter fermentans]|uniref:hypothetical protein n=1 Tax=Abyssisolibacter fermentans TaxID=1766203 RepID=UPI0008328843|nr:hypothetical protein [Abyssisolibacter fermentans]
MTDYKTPLFTQFNDDGRRQKISKEILNEEKNIANSSLQGNITAQGTILCTHGGTDKNDPEGRYTSKSSSTTKTYSDGTPDKRMAEGNVDININTSQLEINTNMTPVGEGQPHNNMQPWACVNYIIYVGK